MKQTRIVKFDRDENGDWFALLECGHTRHMRHRPPWETRTWVLTEQGRALKVGLLIDCRLCEQETGAP